MLKKTLCFYFGGCFFSFEKKIINLKSNESVYISKQTKHRLANHKKEDLIIIEVQYGKLLKEDDIVRYEDIYNRK